MTSHVTTKHVSDARRALKELKDRVEGGNLRTITLNKHMNVGITDNPETFEPVRHTMMDFELIGSISGSHTRIVIIYETSIMHNVEYAVFDEYKDSCLDVSIDEAIQWMIRSDGDDIVERDLLVMMTNTARSIT
ncbi:hypothetical protein H7100_03680 [Candidatus Saccharibacteria bacterium]|nr:hypothetical protein [Candidatus Saccharibacteria bacterium]